MSTELNANLNEWRNGLATKTEKPTNHGRMNMYPLIALRVLRLSFNRESLPRYG